jgi:hypothetical protein
MWPNDYFSFGQNVFNSATFGHFWPWPNKIFPFGRQLFHSARIGKNGRRIGHLATLRKDHCTENALSHMVDRIERAMIEKQAALVVFLDIKGAFDNLHSEVIAHGMCKHDIDEDIILWLQNYLDHRYCRIKGSTQHFRLIGQEELVSCTSKVLLVSPLARNNFQSWTFSG